MTFLPSVWIWGQEGGPEAVPPEEKILKDYYFWDVRSCDPMPDPSLTPLSTCPIFIPSALEAY
eukprot:scaffold39785_cov18-Tisochrysis_lutea.AAC.1